MNSKSHTDELHDLISDFGANNIAPEQTMTSGAKRGFLDWRVYITAEMRTSFILLIKQVITSQRENLGREAMPPDKLISLSEWLEKKIYEKANSFDEYFDSSTIKTRIQDIALAIGKTASSVTSTSNDATNESSDDEEDEYDYIAINKDDPLCKRSRHS